MAEVLDEFDFRNGGSSLYPWDEWFDGRIRRLRQGEDFVTDPRTMRTALQARARKRGGRARTHVKGDSVTFQFFEGAR